MSSLTINFVSSAECDNVRVMRRCTSMNEADFTQVATLQPGASTYTDNTVVFNQTYEYKIGVVFISLNKVFYSNVMTYSLGENILAGTSPSYRLTFDKVITGAISLSSVYSCDFDIHGNSYFGNSNGRVRSMNRSGAERWSVDISNTTISNLITTVTGFIYATAGNNVIKMKADDGVVVWSKQLGTTTLTGLAVNADDSLFICHTGRVSLFDNNGNEIWSHHSMTSTIPGIVCDIRKNVYAVSASPNTVRKINAGGVLEWTTNIASPAGIETHHEVGDYIFVRTGATIHKINKSDGEIVSSIDIDTTSSLNEFKVTSNGNILLSYASANSITMLNSDGEVIWRHPTIGASYSVAISASKQSNMLGLHRLV